MAKKQVVPKAVFKDPKNWIKSYEKWKDILKRTRAHERFIPEYGFDGCEVVRLCGYCSEFMCNRKCYDCPLYKRGICALFEFDNSIFRLYYMEMNVYRTNWKKAIFYARKIYKAILEDKPDGIEIKIEK